MPECGVVMWLTNRRDGSEIVARMRCRAKNCSHCWPMYARHIRRRVCYEMQRNPGSASFASSYLLISKTGTNFRALRVGLTRVGARWVVSPLQGGGYAIVSDRQVGSGWQEVRDLDTVMRYVLKHHDRSRHITSSRSLNAAARQVSVWVFKCQVRQTMERVAEVVGEMGLHGHWSGVDCYVVEGASPQELIELMNRVAA